MQPHCSSCRCLGETTSISASSPLNLDGRGIPEAIRLLDARIDVLVAELCDLRRQRNAHIPVNRMPPEILQNIFLLYRNDFSTAALDWTAVSHVCLRWREVALSNSSLWDSPDLRFPEWAEEMIKRARGTPLHVQYSRPPPTMNTSDDIDYEDFYWNDGCHVQIEPMALLSLSPSLRIDTINLTANIYTITSVLCFHPGQLSYLQQLSVTSTTDDDHHYQNLEDAFRSDQYPRLEHLSLTQCWLSWTSDLLLTPVRLRTLDLQTELEGPQTQHSFRDVLAFLRQQPELEYLILRRALPIRIEEDELIESEDSQKPIILQKLTYLSLHQNPRELQHFLSCIRLSDKCRVKVQLDGTCRRTALAPLRALTSAVFTHAARSAPLNLALRYDDRDRVACCVGEPGLDIEPLIDFLWPSTGLGDFYRERADREALYRQSIISTKHLLAELSPSSLFISIRGHFNPTQDHWRSTLGGMSQVRVVRFEDSEHIPLSFMQELANHEEGTEPLLPNLETLVSIPLFYVLLDDLLGCLKRRVSTSKLRNVYFCAASRSFSPSVDSYLRDTPCRVIWGVDDLGRKL